MMVLIDEPVDLKKKSNKIIYYCQLKKSSDVRDFSLDITQYRYRLYLPIPD
jgi:hypothetical protein